MRVAVVVRTLKIGGMERVAISLAEAFASNGHESHLIYFKKKKKTLSPDKNVIMHHFNLDKLMYLTFIGIFWELFSRISNIFLRKSYFIFKGIFSSQIFKIKLLLLEKKYGKFDLLIIRGQGTLEMIYTIKDPRIVAVSENIFSYGTMNSYIKNFQIRMLYENINLACVSNGVVQNFQELETDENFKCKKICKITNPIDVNYTKKLAQEYIPDLNAPYILSVGRVVPAKNIPLLIDAYAYAKKLNIKHKLVIVGSGSDMSLVQEKIKKLSLEQDVHFTGQLTNPFPWMLHADLFVLSSKFEGLGMVLLEAMACGTKVVSTKSRGGVIDIMKDELSDYLAEQNTEDLGSKIVSALEEKRKIDFEKHLMEFQPKTIVEQYISNFA
ncbi:glycosyltransferase [bacterium]|nr:glycosyltransferase [bacterium]MBU1991045.1 glycosyltransferase [bacterium]